MSKAAVLGTNLRAALKSVRAEADRGSAAIAIVILLALLGPVVLQDSVPLRALAALAYFALAVVGLNFVMGLGNMASIGHGAFIATGALVAAVVRTRLSLSFLFSVLVAVVVTAAATYLVGHGAIRLRAVHLAVSSWLGAWLVALFLSSFPNLSGGAAGLVIPEARAGAALGLPFRVTPLMHFVVGFVLLGIALLLFRGLQVSAIGLTLATIKQNPREASAIGTLRDDIRLKLFVFGGTVAGLAGALGVHLSGLFDAGAYGVLLSVSLFLAVLLGGPGRGWRVVGAAIAVALLPLGGQPFVPVISYSFKGGELFAGALLLAVVGLRARRPPRVTATASEQDSDLVPADEEQTTSPARLTVAGVTKKFGGLVALDGVNLDVEGGSVHGIMGPNGSGKSTLLSIISGHAYPDTGSVSLDGEVVTELPAIDRLRRGVARSLQSTELFPDLTATEHLVAAGLVDRAHGGFIRAMVRTPLARAEDMRARSRSRALLDDFGLTSYADVPAREIPPGARRILLMGVAVAGRRVILLDEPTAGMSPAELRRAAGIILELKDRGAAVIVVEHNLRLLSRIADVVTVLDGGRVVARGEPARIYDDPEVRAAYLGTAVPRG